KKADPAHDITISERNGPADTFGWGVVFSGRTLANLREADEPSYARITQAFQSWDNVDVVHRDQKITIRGNSFSGIARLDLLQILHERCRELSVAVVFREEIAPDHIERNDQDLLVGADGVNSTVREKFKAQFQPTLSVRPNKYIWYGTDHLFHGLTLTFRETQAGVFAAHSYKFNQTTSTFIVECDEPTWHNAGFDKLTEEETRAYLAEVFERDLNGHPLLSNNSKWLNFINVKNAHWSHGKARSPSPGSPDGRGQTAQGANIVLLGDALHTAHFSIGSGTKLALEDAIALKQCFDRTADFGAALVEFEKVRKPIIEEYQAAAQESCEWFENARSYMHLSPLELAYELMTRSGRVDHEKLRAGDPEFVAAYEEELSVKKLRGL
ncbi:MAG TPA: hypothetical protein VN920_10765, partial [Pyrinomonadaceae bacterium]|nr:hypothetical protein [Pyrinomonadaceae bacterium]